MFATKKDLKIMDHKLNMMLQHFIAQNALFTIILDQINVNGGLSSENREKLSKSINTSFDNVSEMYKHIDDIR